MRGRLAGALRAVELGVASVATIARVEIAFARGGSAAARHAFSAMAKRLAAIFGVEIALEGALDPDAAEVRVANHQSYLDILVLASVGAGRFLSRHDVARWPMVGRVATKVGTLYVDRDSTHGRATAFRRLVRALKDGAPLVVFPEGKTATGELLPFEAGAFTLARMAKLPVRPLAIVYDDPTEAAWIGEDELLPHVWKRLSGGRMRGKVIVLDVLDACDAKVARDAIAKALTAAAR